MEGVIMKFIKPLIVSFSMLAFATAYAADEPKAKSEKEDAAVKQGAQSTTGQAPAAAGSTTKADQPKARSESTDAQDKSRPASSSAAGASGPTKKSEPKAKSEKEDAAAGGAMGSTKQRSVTSLDTNNDGSIQPATTVAHAHPAAKFKAGDMAKDGKLTRGADGAVAQANSGAAAGGSTTASQPRKKSEPKAKSEKEDAAAGGAGSKP